MNLTLPFQRIGRPFPVVLALIVEINGFTCLMEGLPQPVILPFLTPVARR
jgi:hypothetical protein